jgi:hypothetical protein
VGAIFGFEGNAVRVALAIDTGERLDLTLTHSPPAAAAALRADEAVGPAKLGQLGAALWLRPEAGLALGEGRGRILGNQHGHARGRGGRMPTPFLLQD